MMYKYNVLFDKFGKNIYIKVFYRNYQFFSYLRKWGIVYISKFSFEKIGKSLIQKDFFRIFHIRNIAYRRMRNMVANITEKRKEQLK